MIFEVGDADREGSSYEQPSVIGGVDVEAQIKHDRKERKRVGRKIHPVVRNVLGASGWARPGDLININTFITETEASMQIHISGFLPGGAGRYDDLSVRALYDECDTAIRESERQGNRANADRVMTLRNGLRGMMALLRSESLWSARSRDAHAFKEIRAAFKGARDSEAGAADPSTAFQQLESQNLSNGWDQIMEQFGLIMRNQYIDRYGAIQNRDRAYTHAEMIKEIHDRAAVSPNGEHDPNVWARLVAWSLYRLSGGLALEDRDIRNIHEDKGIKKTCGNIVRTFDIEQTRKADVSRRTLQMLNDPVRVIEIRNEKGEVIGSHGKKLNGETMTHAEVFGVDILWLELSRATVNNERGGFWLQQPNKNNVLRRVIERHTKMDLKDSAGAIIEVPVDAEDLKLIDWTNVRTANGKSILLDGNVYDSWLERCGEAEESRALVLPILSAMGEGIQGMQKAAELAGELSERDVHDTTIYYGHVPPERGRAEIAFFKSMALDLYVRWAEWEEARDRKFQEKANAVLSSLGGDAQQNEEIYGRDMSSKSLLAEPVTPHQAACWLLKLCDSGNVVDFSYTGADKFKRGISILGFGGGNLTTKDILDLAGQKLACGTLQWQPEDDAETFSEWLEIVRDELPQEPMNRNQFNEMTARLYKEAATNKDAKARLRANNLLFLINQFCIPTVRYSFLQQNFIDDVVRTAIDYYNTDLPDKYQRYLQYEACVKTMVDNLDRFTTNGEGERILKLMYSGIYGSSFARGYAEPAARHGANTNCVMEINDRRTTDFILLMGHPQWVERAFIYNKKPLDERGRPIWFDQAYDDVGLRRLIMEYARKRNEGKEGQPGFYDTVAWRHDLKKWWCEDSDVTWDFTKQIIFGVVDENDEKLVEMLKNSPERGLFYSLFGAIPFIGGIAEPLRKFNAGPWITSVADIALWGSLAYPLAKTTLMGGIWDMPLPFIEMGEFYIKSIPEVAKFMDTWLPTIPNFPIWALNARGLISAWAARTLLLSARIPAVGWRINLHGLLSARWLEFNNFGRHFSVRATKNSERGKQVETSFSLQPL